MQQIGLTPEQFQAFRNKLYDLQNQINSEMNAIEKTATDMQEVWQGNASTKFRTDITDWKARNLTQFNEIMSEAISRLDKYKENMLNIDNKSF